MHFYFLFLFCISVMQRQLDKIDRNVNKICEHKAMSQSCDKLKSEVKEFVDEYRVEIKKMDDKGKEMMETYTKILVRFT